MIWWLLSLSCFFKPCVACCMQNFAAKQVSSCAGIPNCDGQMHGIRSRPTGCLFRKANKSAWILPIKQIGQNHWDGLHYTIYIYTYIYIYIYPIYHSLILVFYGLSSFPSSKDHFWQQCIQSSHHRLFLGCFMCIFPQSRKVITNPAGDMGLSSDPQKLRIRAIKLSKKKGRGNLQNIQYHFECIYILYIWCTICDHMWAYGTKSCIVLYVLYIFVWNLSRFTSRILETTPWVPADAQASERASQHLRTTHLQVRDIDSIWGPWEATTITRLILDWSSKLNVFSVFFFGDLYCLW